MTFDEMKQIAVDTLNRGQFRSGRNEPRRRFLPFRSAALLHRSIAHRVLASLSRKK